MADKKPLPRRPSIYGGDEASEKARWESMFKSVLGRDQDEKTKAAGQRTAEKWARTFYNTLKDAYKKYEGVEETQWQEQLKIAIDHAKERAEKETETYFDTRKTAYESAEKGYASAQAEIGYSTKQALGTARAEDRTALDIKAIKGDDAKPAQQMLSASVEYVKALREAQLPEDEFKKRAVDGLARQLQDIQSVAYLSDTTKKRLVGEITKLQASIGAESFGEKFKTALKGQASQGLANVIKNLPGMGAADVVGQLLGKGKLSDRLAGRFDIEGRGSRESGAAAAEESMARGMGTATSLAGRMDVTRNRLLEQQLETAGGTAKQQLNQYGVDTQQKTRQIAEDTSFYKKLATSPRYIGPGASAGASGTLYSDIGPARIARKLNAKRQATSVSDTSPIPQEEAKLERDERARARAQELKQEAMTTPAGAGDSDLQNALEAMTVNSDAMSSTLQKIHDFLTEETGLKKILEEVAKKGGGGVGDGITDTAMDLATSRGGRGVLGKAGKVLGGRGGGLLSKVGPRALGLGSRLGGAAKFAGRLAGKAALPLAAGMAGYDAYKGFNADPNLSLGGKLMNAGKGVASGLTFGLSDYVTGGVTTGTPAASTTPEQKAGGGGSGGALDDGEKFTLANEGVRTRPYKDSLGLWTVGVGHLIGDGKNLPPEMNRDFSQDEVMSMYKDDYAKAEKGASQTPGFGKMNEMGKDALTDLAFNMGTSWYKKFPSTSAALARGDGEASASGLTNSLWFRQVGNRGPKVVSMVRTGFNASASGADTSTSPVASSEPSKNLGETSSTTGAGGAETGGGATSPTPSYAYASPTRAAGPVASGTSTLATQQSAANTAPIVMGLQGAQQAASAAPPIMQPIPIPIRPRNDDRMLESLRAVNIV